MGRLKHNQELLQLNGISKEYELNSGESLKAVSSVSLTVQSGECVAVAGESGCGKSTLVKLVAHIESLSSGTMIYDGKDVTRIRGEELRQYRRQVQMIFQDPAQVFSPRMKIGTFLMEPWRNYEKTSRKEAEKQALYALERVQLGKEYFHKYPHQLSGGELQRVSIARAIALHPRLLICDEATSALDVSVQKQIIELLKEHQRENGFSLLFICHDLALAEDFGTRMVVMYLGHIVEILKAGEIRNNARHPYTRALLDSVFSIRDRTDKAIHVLPGEPPSPAHLPEGCVFCDRCSYAQKLCFEVRPELISLDESHKAACHRLQMSRQMK